MTQEPTTTDVFRIALNAANIGFNSPYLYGMILDLATMCNSKPDCDLKDFGVILAKYGNEIQEAKSKNTERHIFDSQLTTDIIVLVVNQANTLMKQLQEKEKELQDYKKLADETLNELNK